MVRDVGLGCFGSCPGGVATEDGVTSSAKDGGSGLAGYCERCGAAPAERGVVGGREHDSIASSELVTQATLHEYDALRAEA